MTAVDRLRSRDVVHGFGALLLGILLTTGVPILLWKLAGWPLPGRVPSIEGLRLAVSRSTVPEVVIVKAVALIGWGAWLLLCWSLLVEVWAWGSGRPSPRLRFAGPTQAFARQLITSVSVMATLTLSQLHSPAALAAAGAPVASAQVVPVIAVGTTVAAEPVAAPSAPEPSVPIYTVRRHDSLWRIAERQLGDPLRWREIWELNCNRDFNGVRFRDANLIYPGWELTLPPLVLSTHLIPAPVTPVPTPPPPPSEIEPAPPTTAPLQPSQPPPMVTESTTSTAAGVAVTTTSTVAHQDEAANGQEEVSGDDAADRHDVALFSGGTILATALVILLTRLRRSQSRRRKPGSTPHRPSTGTSVIETALRHDADVPRLTRLNASLRAFANGLPPDSVPEIAAVRVAADEVEVLLSSSISTVPAGFEDRGDRRAFATEPHLSAAALAALGVRDGPAPWPAIVSVGNLGPDVVLLDLETAGLLTVDGADAQSTVRRMAAELAASPLSDLLDLVVVGEDFDLAASERVRVVETADLGIDAIEQAIRATSELLERIGVTDTPTARCARASEHVWGVTILVSLEPLDDAQTTRLTNSLLPGNGAAALVVGPAVKGSWALTVNGSVHLRPHNFELDAAPLAETDLRSLSELLSDASVGDADEALLSEPPSVEHRRVPRPSVRTVGGSLRLRHRGASARVGRCSRRGSRQSTANSRAHRLPRPPPRRSDG